MERKGDGWCEAYAGDRHAIGNPNLAVEKHLIRDSDVPFVCGLDNYRLHSLNKGTGATVAIISNASSRKFQLKLLAFYGTSEQVAKACQVVSVWFMWKYNTREPKVFIPSKVHICRLRLNDSKVRFLLETKHSELLEVQRVSKTSIQLIECKNSGEESLLEGFFMYGLTVADVTDAHKKIVSMLDKKLDGKGEHIDYDSYSDDVKYETELPVKHGNSDSDDMEHEAQLPAKHGNSEAENETQLSKKRRIMDPYSGAENETQAYDDSEGMEMDP